MKHEEEHLYNYITSSEGFSTSKLMQCLVLHFREVAACARESEREACAQIADQAEIAWLENDEPMHAGAIAKAIRERGK